MSRTVTLSQLRTDVRNQADLVGATVRHDNTLLTRLINQSIQGFREAISLEGEQHFLVAYSGTLTAGATSPYSFGSLDLSAISPSIVRVHGIDVTVDGVVCSLKFIPFRERNTWGGPVVTGIPRDWTIYQTAKLGIHPAPNQAYSYTLWYLPVLADLSGDSDTFDGVAGWEEWVVWDVVCKLLIRDQQSAAFASAKLYKDETWNRIHKQATRVSSAGGAVVGRDTLRGRIPDPLAARGPVMAGGGLPSAHSITLAMLVEQTGPIFLGRITGTGDVQAMTPAQSAGILPTFTPSAAGLVPAAGGSSTTKFLSQAGTFETVSSSGGGSPGGPSGSIQFAGLSGFVGYTGFAVQGSPPSMTVRLPGSLRVTGGTVDVGSGTVRISASGIDLGGAQLANVSSLFAFPTFAAGVPGLVPASDNDPSKFLNAAGGFAVPPGTGGGGSPALGSGAIQYNGTNNAFSASPNWSFQSPSGSTLVAGVPTGQAFTSADLGVYGLFTIVGKSNQGGDQTLYQWAPSGLSAGPTGSALTYGRGSGTIQMQRFQVAPSGHYRWEIGATGGPGMELHQTGLDLTRLHVAARGLSVASLIPNTLLTQMLSGTVKANLAGLSQPADVQIPTLAALFPTFTSNRAGLVAPSDGDTSKFLNAAGAFSIPAGGGTPTGVLNSQLADMPSGTVKARLTGTGAPQDVLIPTLMMHFPTFAAGRAGLVPAGSDGDSSKFLNAAGDFSIPAGGAASPGGGSGAIQFNSGSGFNGFTGVSIIDDGFGVNSRHGITFGNVNVAQRAGLNSGELRAASGFSLSVATPSGGRAFPYVYSQSTSTATGGFINYGAQTEANGREAIRAHAFYVASGGAYTFGFGNDLSDVRFSGTGARFINHLHARSITVFSGIPNTVLSPMASGTVKAQLGAVTTPDDVYIPTLFAFAPTMTSSRAGIVGPGGGDLSQFLRGDGAFAAPTGYFSTPTGLLNANLAPMPSGTVKANLSGTAAPSDLAIPTLMMHFPTFTTGKVGLVPATSDGDSSKFLNAAGGFSVPAGGAANPGGGLGNFQFHNGVGFGGASGVNVAASGVALAIGPPALVANAGDVRVGSGFSMQGRNASGIAQPIVDFWVATGAARFGSSGLYKIENDVATGGVQEFTFGGVTATSMLLLPTGIHAPSFHGNLKSLNVGHINGLPFDFAGLKRGIDITTASGNAIPSGMNLYLPRGAGSGANRYIMPSGVVGTGTQFVTLNPTGGRGGGVIRIEKHSASASNFEVRTPTGTVLYAFPSGTKNWADFMFEKPSGAVFQLAGQGDLF